MRYISVDLETTGLNPETCDIVEFGAVLDDLENPLPLDELPRFHAYVFKDLYQGEPYALSMHPEIFKRIAKRKEEEYMKKYNYVNAQKLSKSFKNFLVSRGYDEKNDRVSINVAGKNFMSFDYNFLKKAGFGKHVNIRHRGLDPAILYAKIGDSAVPGTEECLKRAGIEKTVAHTAIEDALDVIKLIRIHYLGKY